MNIYTKAKVVTDGVFQRRETGCRWHCGLLSSVSMKSCCKDCCAYTETILQKIVGFEWRMQSRWGQHQDFANLTNNIKQENRHVLEIEANIILPYALMLME